ncbi:MAG: hypothetical protein U0746_02050 [Gemmataceae bacterium]
MTHPHPYLTLLSNGRYGVVFTDAGSGVSTWNGMDVTRWREDATRDCWGQFVYIRDRAEGRIWSVGAQPLGEAARYDVALLADRAEISRRDGDIETKLTVCVPPDRDCELRIVTLTNTGRTACELDVTSYAEVCLNHRRADAAHPAFAKLFLETTFADGALFARRRPRAADQKPVFAVHACTGDGPLEYETDRARFLGRGRTAANPAALTAELSGTTGPVLDPCFALRRRVSLAPGATARVVFSTGAAGTREDAVALATAFRDPAYVDQALSAAATTSSAELQQLGVTTDDLALFHRLAANVCYTGTNLRRPDSVAANQLGQPGLWPHAISGDRPIALAEIASDTDVPLALQLTKWHQYVTRRGLDLDLVIIDERPGEQLRSILAGSRLGQPGGVFLLDAAKVPSADRTLLEAAARVVLDGSSIAAQFERSATTVILLPPQRNSRPTSRFPTATADRPKGLLFFNGIGGFTSDGREYVVAVDSPKTMTPAPWTNVLANPGFGCLVTESGSGYTWAGNSQMNRLTPWSNDPVSDPSGEVVYLRDEVFGDLWTTTPLPCGPGPVTVRHGQGYTRFSRTSHGIDQDLLVVVPPDDPVKLYSLTVRNSGSTSRRLTATFYIEWVLGGTRDAAPLTVVCERDPRTNALVARSAWAGDFAGKLAFAAAANPSSVTSDRSEFLGRLGSTATPVGLARAQLSGRVGVGPDPCAAIQIEVELAAGQSKELTFVLGQANDIAAVRKLVGKHTAAGAGDAALNATVAQWDRVLGAVTVATPSPAMDVLLNRWLVYQALACRLWGRSAFYQSGGAYGFRDQLQDSMALVYGAPQEARAQIVRSAARQFPEGDVQHWWHPPAGRGVRTRITDDLFFLPYVVCHYVATTGDVSVLDERVPFLSAPVLRPDQEEVYDLPGIGTETATIYEHCLLVLKHAERVGPHGIPLMGTGDWNDGMNKVGAHGKGESVWNGWFMIRVLTDFVELAMSRGDSATATYCRERAEAIRAALEAHAWDGNWYRRAYFDDGTPLGSAENDECQIDALPQAWSVISGVADPARSAKAMAALDWKLVDKAGQLIHLFVPPFDDGPLQPGYIKGYVPGIRENGGQYTHGVTWAILATALQGRGDRAVELWEMLNPVHHTSTPAEVELYKVEPYVICADVYGAPPHVGRGGWTWYTGASAWMYRVALEGILGLRLRADTLAVEPCIAKAWPGYEITVRHKTATYRVFVDNAAGVGRGVTSVSLDNTIIASGIVPLADDGRTHEVRIVLG